MAKERFLSLVAVSAVALTSPIALAGSGSVEFHSSSYLRTSPDRVTNAGAFHIDYETSRDGQWLSTAGQFSVDSYAGDLKSITPEMRELYLATSPGLSQHHQIALGRMVHEWSVADSAWALGDWSPRYIWNPLKPKTVGLTGFHYSYNSKYFSIRAFASPVNIPERGAPIHTENGRLVSSNPDAAVQYESVSVMNAQVPIRYTINMPPMKDLLFHPSALVQVRFGQQKAGPWASFSAGFKPINSPDITAQATLKLTPSEYIDAQLYPRIVSHDLMTLEAGIKNKSFDLWTSLTRELPKGSSLEAERVGSPMGPALIGSAGVDTHLSGPATLRASVLSIHEQLATNDGSTVTISLPGRYRFKRAASLGVE
ncbi:hypothetical protein EBZ37_02470, partial [bacterium]|nr:hypothetical protein [bacterium]